MPGGKSCPTRVNLRTLAYNVGLDLCPLFRGDTDGLTEPSGHQAGVRQHGEEGRTQGTTDEGSQTG